MVGRITNDTDPQLVGLEDWSDFSHVGGKLKHRRQPAWLTNQKPRYEVRSGIGRQKQQQQQIKAKRKLKLSNYQEMTTTQHFWSLTSFTSECVGKVVFGWKYRQKQQQCGLWFKDCEAQNFRLKFWGKTTYFWTGYSHVLSFQFWWEHEDKNKLSRFLVLILSQVK